jgi:hypothetical protein
VLPRDEDGVPELGDRLLIGCEGGPTSSRLVHHPPPLEITERGGIYVLDDEGAPDTWRYVWVPDG